MKLRLLIALPVLMGGKCFASFETFKKCVEEGRCTRGNVAYAERDANKRTIILGDGLSPLHYLVDIEGEENYETLIIDLTRKTNSFHRKEFFKLSLDPQQGPNRFLMIDPKGNPSLTFSSSHYGTPLLDSVYLLPKGKCQRVYEGDQRGTLAVVEADRFMPHEQGNYLLEILKQEANKFQCKQVILIKDLVKELTDEQVQWYLDRNFVPTDEGFVLEISE